MFTDQPPQIRGLMLCACAGDVHQGVMQGLEGARCGRANPATQKRYLVDQTRGREGVFPATPSRASSRVPNLALSGSCSYARSVASKGSAKRSSQVAIQHTGWRTRVSHSSKLPALPWPCRGRPAAIQARIRVRAATTRARRWSNTCWSGQKLNSRL